MLSLYTRPIYDPGATDFISQHTVWTGSTFIVHILIRSLILTLYLRIISVQDQIIYIYRIN